MIFTNFPLINSVFALQMYLAKEFNFVTDGSLPNPLKAFGAQKSISLRNFGPLNEELFLGFAKTCLLLFSLPFWIPNKTKLPTLGQGMRQHY